MRGLRVSAIAACSFLLALACSCSPGGGSDVSGDPSLPEGVVECAGGGSPRPTKDDPSMNRITLSAFLNDLARDVGEGQMDGNYSKHLVGEDGISILSFDLAEAAVSSPIPSYKVNSEGTLEPFHLMRAPLFVGGEIAAFVLYETTGVDDSATYIGIGELGAKQVNDFFRKYGDIAFVYDSEGAWMVSGDMYERVDADVMDWLYPVDTGKGSVGITLAPYEFSECVSVGEAELATVDGTDLSYRCDIVPSPHECSEEKRFTVPSPRNEVPCAKPVIYLYPKESCVVEVALELEGTVGMAYPAFNEERSASEGSWKVQADPDGTLSDLHVGREYGYLFWEGVGDWEPDFDRGFCIAGADTAEFLEDALRQLGLTDKEADDFITYWLPQMQGNPYNLVSFQREAYDRAARLTVEPQPDTIIRVFMAWMRLDEPVVVEPQELSAPARSGFTVVEWGGGEVSVE